ncbi:DUF5689 domain-containing protein [Alistipes onderdonkii]|uniref:DUF5689 domain-containing protein n=1 Tax=Alistipes onderdonkii TaxID=328813 RepID=UPI0018A8C0AB|nr:DUF5689 domain-containing protein [Alistipes onderdonkii]
MSKHLFRLLFGAFFLVAATAFTGCSDDDDKSLTPKLTADPTALDFTDETATTQTVAITANCEWTVTASNLDWATISPMSGKGNGTISVTVSELPAGTNLREGKISFTLIHPEFGKWGQAESSVAVKQYGSGVTPPPTGEAVVITIPEIIAKLTTSQVALDTNNDRYFEAVVVTDKEGGNFNGQNLQVMTPGATTAKNGITLYGSGKYTDPYDDGFTFVKGDKVKVTLKKGEARIVSYNGLYEVTGSKGADWVEIEKIGTETITPVVVDPAKLAEYQGMVVTVKGVTAPATAADWTTNEAFGKHTFTTSAGNMTVFVQKAMPGLVGTQFVAGSTGDITGYASVNSNAAQVCPQRPEDVAAFMGEPSTDPAITKLDPTSLSFAATDNAKTVTVTAANADGCTIEAATDKSEQFTTFVNGMVVTVTPKENTTEQAITATLTIKLMKDGAAVDTKTVAISQAGKSGAGGDGQQITLTLDDIIAIGGKSGAYAKFTYTNTFGEWSGKAAGGSSGKECLQINVKGNSAFGSFVQIPAVDGTIEKIEVTIREPYKGRAIGIFPVGYTYTKDTLDKMKEQLAKDAIAISNETPSDVNNNEPFTFVIDNLSAKNLTQFSIFPTLGAVSITAITVTYSK